MAKAVQEERPLHQGRIVQDPDILVGKPVIRGTRISVELVLKRLAEGLDLKTLFESYPRLTPEDVKACLEYAHALVERKKKRERPNPTEATPAAR